MVPYLQPRKLATINLLSLTEVWSFPEFYKWNCITYHLLCFLLSLFLKFIHVPGMINLLSFQVGFVMVFHYGFNLHFLIYLYYLFMHFNYYFWWNSIYRFLLAWFALLCSNKSLLNLRTYLLFASRSFYY